MYFTKNMYQKYASYQDISSLKFFHKMCQMAQTRYESGKKLKKTEAPVVYGTTVQDFNEDEDSVIARIEMNQRGVLRDFIGIDWDFEENDKDKLEKLLNELYVFAHKHQTPVYIYPTHSYPTKPRVRTVMFSKELMDGMEYAKAVTFVEEQLGVNPNDEGNYNISHNFNLPVFNSREQLDAFKCYLPHNSKPLDNTLWEETKPKKKGYKQNYYVPEVPVTESEKENHTREDIDEGLKVLSDNIKAKRNKKLDFSIWSNFFQFLHALARAEVTGAITHDDARYILQVIAGHHSDWERRNYEDYMRELPRVKSNKDKLLRARRLTYYFGINW